ncbi:hypothetical protein E2I00_008317, partial [Balaenoptera physalus]
VGIRTVEHGFPHQPSALGYSPSLRILAIGTRSGACQLVTLLDDNSLHLWSLKVKGGVSELQEDESFTLRGSPGAAPSATQITVVLPHSSCQLLYLGTESGSVFVVQLPAFRALEDRTISPDAVLQRNIPGTPTRSSSATAGALSSSGTYRAAVCSVISSAARRWDRTPDPSLRALSLSFPTVKQLENVCWQRDGHLIVSCHSDGSYCQWPVSSDTLQPEPLRSCVPYGPFPCKAITKIFWLTTKQGLPFTIFQGGMPRASYGDRHCISVVHNGQQTAFDFTSRVIDFTVLIEANPEAAFDDPYALVVLAEEELVVIDLQTAGWPPVQPPYLASLHCSAITCSHHVSNIPLKLDDPRLGIQKIFLCKYSGYLAVAGTAGQVLVLELNDEEAEHAVEQVEADLLQDQEGYRWKGHERLCARPGPVHFEPGFQPFVLVQCQPPAVVTSLALHSEWRLVAFGTSHGFGLFDHQQRRQVFVKCTLHPNDQLALEGPLSRVKSLKKSLRQSFRRIRRSRVQEGSSRAERTGLQNMELAPVQRKIEARSAEDSFTGFVRTLYFADTYLRDSSRHCPSLWAGTNGGTVYTFALRVPPAERRMDEPVRAEQAKEIQLMHRAPVVGILVLDGHSVPLPEPLEVAHDLSKSPDMQGSHQLLVVSEEQFKVFTLPKVSARLKLKLTALEGSRVVSLPLLKPQVRYSCIRREDVSGIASCVFTKYGQGFYLISPSEFERFSLSTKWLVEPRCLVDSAETKNHSRLRDKSGPEKALGRARNSGSQSDGEERRSSPMMEHALLNDESVLKEIQSTLEGGRGSCGDWRSQRVADAPELPWLSLLLHNEHTLLTALPGGTAPPGEGRAGAGGTPSARPAAAPGLGRGGTPGPWGSPSSGLDSLGPFVNVAQFLSPSPPLFVVGWVLNYKCLTASG